MNSYDVQAMQHVAYMIAQTVAAWAIIESMKAANTERMCRGEALAYNEDAFAQIPDQYGLHHNAVVKTLYN